MPISSIGILVGVLALVGAGVSGCTFLNAEEYAPSGYCNGGGGKIASELSHGSHGTIQWTPDGSHILFNNSGDRTENPRLEDLPDVYAVHVSGNPLKKVLDLPTRNPALSTRGVETTFDLSADGSRIVYATCAVSDETVEFKGDEYRVLNYEIFVSNFDGGKKRRLTNNTYLDVLPAWSPDGESLAFISDPDRSVAGIWKATAHTRLTIQEVATGRSRVVGLPEGKAAAPIRLEWSPSGDRIAFVMLEGVRHPWNLAVYTVRADGSGLTRVSDALSGPTWSPDGEAMAMVVPEGDHGESLYIFAADGSNLVKKKYWLDTSKLGGKWWTEIGKELWMGNLSWSPDGFGILIERFEWEGRPAVLELGTGSFMAGVPGSSHAPNRALSAGSGAGSILASPLIDFWPTWSKAAWSSDGTQIAIRYDVREFFDLEVVDLQGNAEVVLQLKRFF